MLEAATAKCQLFRKDELYFGRLFVTDLIGGKS